METLLKPVIMAFYSCLFKRRKAHARESAGEGAREKQRGRRTPPHAQESVLLLTPFHGLSKDPAKLPMMLLISLQSDLASLYVLDLPLKENFLHPEITPSFILILTCLVLLFLRLTFFSQNQLRMGAVYWAERNNSLELAAQLRQSSSQCTNNQSV